MGVVGVIMKTPLYQATASVEMVGFNPTFMGMGSVDPQAGTDAVRETTSNTQTQIKILTSRTLLRRVIDRMNLELSPISSTPATVFTRIRAHIPFGRQDPFVQSREALQVAASTVFVRAVPPTRLIEITCQSTSPEIAANFVNTVTFEHLSQSTAARANITQKTSQWMESQLEEARSRLQQAGEKLREFVQKSGVDFFPEQSTLADSKLKELQAEVSVIQGDRISKQARWELVKNTPLDGLADVAHDPSLEALKGQLITFRTERAQLLATLMPENPKVERVQARITEIERTLETEKVALLNRSKSDYEEALRKERMLSGAYSSQTHAVSAQSDKSAQYAMLRRDVDTEQTLYMNLLQKSSEAALVALVPTSSIRVVDEASPNRVPISPNPSKDIPVGAFAGAGLGYGLILLREFVRRQKLTKLFDAPGYSQLVLGVPELGVIPSTEMFNPRKRLSVRSSSRGSDAVLDVNSLDVATENGDSVLDSWQDDRSSMLSESFRQTLVSLLRTKPQNHSPVYVITSAGPGEGKTTLSINLARAMAETGQRVLLVDADLRRPNIHSRLGMDNHEGLSDILTSPLDIKDIELSTFVQPTQIDNLSVMMHGLMKVETPALLFFSPKVSILISLLQSKFDCILFDTAPALPFPDARLWGKYSDGVVMVVRSGVTTREGASAACERFLNDGVSVLGTILNDWAPTGGASDAYKYGYYQTANSKEA